MGKYLSFELIGWVNLARDHAGASESGFRFWNMISNMIFLYLFRSRVKGYVGSEISDLLWGDHKILFVVS